MTPGTRRAQSGCAAVVLAGGGSRRFGSDKLAAPIAGRPLLDHSLVGLGEDVTVFVVGPQRPVQRGVTFLREDPPGGGPAAAMVAGLTAALAAEAERMVVLPGDAPYGGRSAVLLLRALADSPTAQAVVGTDASGFEQPLQLALLRSSAAQLVAAAGPDRARGGSARALVKRLDPPALRFALPADATADIDTPDQLRLWSATPRTWPPQD